MGELDVERTAMELIEAHEELDAMAVSRTGALGTILTLGQRIKSYTATWRMFHEVRGERDKFRWERDEARQQAERLQEAARLFVKDVEDYYDDDLDYVGWFSYRQLKAALAADQPEAQEEAVRDRERFEGQIREQAREVSDKLTAKLDLPEGVVVECNLDSSLDQPEAPDSRSGERGEGE